MSAVTAAQERIVSSKQKRYKEGGDKGGGAKSGEVVYVDTTGKDHGYQSWWDDHWVPSIHEHGSRATLKGEDGYVRMEDPAV